MIEIQSSEEYEKIMDRVFHLWDHPEDCQYPMEFSDLVDAVEQWEWRTHKDEFGEKGAKTP